MAGPGFQKAKAEQAAIKMAMFGPAGSGKTFTSLLIGEGLGQAGGKRVAVIDTERGTDFYVKCVPARQSHPDAFDIDCLYTRSLIDTLGAVQGLKANEHGVIIIDSMTHLWEAAIGAYRGKRTSAGTIPMQAWDGIKKPYKQLMHFLINSPFHVLILGRQANEWGNDDSTGELVQTGFKMRAEGETAYEPHMLIRMEAIRPRDGKRVLKQMVAVPTAFVEKDRTGVLSGKLIEWPSYENIAGPIVGLLGDTQAKVQGDDEAATHDAEATARQKAAFDHASRNTREEFQARLRLSKTEADVRAVSCEVTDDVKKQMLASDVDTLRSAVRTALDRVRAAAKNNGNGAAHANGTPPTKPSAPSPPVADAGGELTPAELAAIEAREAAEVARLEAERKAKEAAGVGAADDEVPAWAR